MTAHATRRRPSNLDQAPEFLTQADASHALGVSLDAIKALESNAAGFPQRRKLPFTQRPVFARRELVAWVAAQMAAAEVGA